MTANQNQETPKQNIRRNKETSKQPSIGEILDMWGEYYSIVPDRGGFRTRPSDISIAHEAIHSSELYEKSITTILDMAASTLLNGESSTYPKGLIVIGEDGVGKNYFVETKLMEILKFTYGGYYILDTKKIAKSMMHQQTSCMDIFNIIFDSLMTLSAFQDVESGCIYTWKSKAGINMGTEGDILLYIRDIHNVMNSPQNNITNIILDTFITRSLEEKCPFVLTTTKKGYEKLCQMNSKFSQIPKVELNEPSYEIRKDILLARIKEDLKYEMDGGVGNRSRTRTVEDVDPILDLIVKNIIEFSTNHVKDKYAPFKDYELYLKFKTYFNYTNSYFKQAQDLNYAVDKLKKDIARANSKKTRLLRADNPDNKKIGEVDSLIAEYKNQMGQYSKQLNALEDTLKRPTINKAITTRDVGVVPITEKEIQDAIKTVLGIKTPKTNIDFLKQLPDKIKEQVKGQDETIDAVVSSIRKHQLGFRNGTHPIGCFMFVGPTGVGKTELAKQLALNVFGDPNRLLRFDMSEYQSDIDCNKLIGSPPGYVGYKESGLLIKLVEERPNSVILFDEIEKASTRVILLLLQLLDEGFIVSGDGRKVMCNNCIVVMTSNIGVKQSKQTGNIIGFNNGNSEEYEHARAIKEQGIIEKHLKNKFPPEFIGRLDRICMFNSLTKQMLFEILDVKLKTIQESVFKILNKHIAVSENAKEKIVNDSYTSGNGARELQRMLSLNIEEALTDKYISGELPDSDDLILDYKDKENAFKIEEHAN